MRRKKGENVGCAQDQNHFLLESWYSTDMIPGSVKNVHMYIVPQLFGPIMWQSVCVWGGLDVFLLK